MTTLEANLNRAGRRAQASAQAHGADADEVSRVAGIAAAGRSVMPEGCSPALNTVQAAIYTGLAEKTLETLRTRGGGPRFVKYGRKAVRYLKADLDAFMAARSVGSTSERAAA